MRRLLLAALVMTMSATGLAGMGISTRRWKQFQTSGSFLGVFRDYRGARAAFFVEDKTGALIGPLDLDAPNGPGWILAPGPEPTELRRGDFAEVVFAGIVAAERPFGFPPREDLAKSRAARTANDPSEGMFVSAVKQPPKTPTATRDPLALALQGRLVAGDRQAAIGFLLKRDAEQFRALGPPPDLARLASLIFNGLAGMQGPYAPIAHLWVTGKKDDARALYRARKDELHFFMQTDRWRRPFQPMESSPGAPLQGPFLRVAEWGDLDGTALFYLAPEFARFLAH